MSKKYQVQGQTVEISAISRNSIKVGENFFTIESKEVRSIPYDEEVEIDMDAEWEDLFDSVNAATDAQIADIYEEVERQRAEKKKKK